MNDMLLADTPAVLPVPLAPPLEWFTEVPEWADLTWEAGVVQVADSGPEVGRVVALVAPYGECILDGSRECWQPPESPTDYEYAHVGAIQSAEGHTVRVANVGGGAAHFDPSRATAMSPAIEHYANTTTRTMYGRYYDRPDLGGIIFLGAMHPGTTPVDVFEARLSALSGDWRWVVSLNAYDFAGAQMVNVPGFRPNRAAARRTWQVPRLAAMNFAVVACMGPSDDEVLMGAWTPTAPDPASLADRLYRLERAVVALLDGAVDDDPLMETCPLCGDRFDPSVPPLPYVGAAGDRVKGKVMGAERLRQYWLNGEGAAKIRWGTPGDWTRCFEHLSKYLGPRAKGYCQLMHGRANGTWAGRGHSEVPNPAVKARAIAKQYAR